MKRKGSALWRGGIKQGKGELTTGSGVLDATPYGFSSRFEEGKGTNPEELIAAAHAGCFSMALSKILGEADIAFDDIATSAVVSLDRGDDGFAITRVHLDVKVRAPGADADAVVACAKKAKEGCPVSKVLRAEITMDAGLAS